MTHQPGGIRASQGTFSSLACICICLLFSVLTVYKDYLNQYSISETFLLSGGA